MDGDVDTDNGGSRRCRSYWLVVDVFCVACVVCARCCAALDEQVEDMLKWNGRRMINGIRGVCRQKMFGAKGGDGTWWLVLEQLFTCPILVPI